MIRVNGLYKIYNQGNQNEFSALKNIDLYIDDDELLAITGESGAGKSTLLHILSGIEDFEAGEVEIEGFKLGGLSDKKSSFLRNSIVGLVLQDYALLDDFTTLDNVMIPLYFSKVTNRQKKQKAIEALERVGITSLMHKPVRYLSGGQKQRVAIARAIVNYPKYLLADEPTGALDSNTADEILELFLALNRQGMGVIIVTHNSSITSICNRIIKIRDGILISDMTIDR